MRQKGSFVAGFFHLATALVVAVLFIGTAWGSSETVIYSFTGGADGSLPTSNLIADASGNLYGTTSEGGNTVACGPFGVASCGVVFALIKSNSGWTETVLYSFTGGADGGTPYAGLVMDSAGNLYGTTNAGGAHGQGTVFELSNSGGTWTETVLYSFAGSPDGAAPEAGLILHESAGIVTLAGTTTVGGTGTGCIFGTTCGTVFRLSQNGSGWTEQVMYSFQGGSDGGIPFAGLTFDNHGNLYGTTTQYGLCCGTIFELSPRKSGYVLSTLYTFTGGADGSYSRSTLIRDHSGNLYGTTSAGANQLGTVFQLQKIGSSWKLNTLHTFTDSPDGAVPDAGLVQFGQAVFGTTFNGGTGSECGPFGGIPCGTVYELTRANGVKYSVVYSFPGAPDAAQPMDSLYADPAGNLYGTGFIGGTFGFGAIFEITP